MSDRFYSDKRQRRSKRYQLLHAQLRAEVAEARKPEPSKQATKREASNSFRLRGE